MPTRARARRILLLLSVASMGCLRVTAEGLGPDAGPDTATVSDAGAPPDAASVALDAQAEVDAASGPDSGPDASVPQGYCSPSGWCWEYPRPHGDMIMGFWGPTDAGGLFATTSGGRVLEQTATGWRVAASIESGLTSIHGSGPNDIWVGGTYGACRSLHFDGTAWRRVESPPSAPGDKAINCFMNFWSLGPKDVLGGVNTYLGERPLLFTWDGETWNEERNWGWGDHSSWSFAGRNRSELMAVRNMSWLAWTPGGWEERDYGPFYGFNGLRAVWTDGAERWFVGALATGEGFTAWRLRVLRQDAAGTWSMVGEWPVEPFAVGGRLAGASRTDLYFSTPEGLKHWNGVSLAAVPAPFPDAVTALWWDSRTGLLWAGGSGGSIASWDGSAWTSTSPEDQVFGALRGLWCDGVEPVAVGDGRILVRAAHGWKVEWSGAERLYAVWGPAGGSSAWAVGDSGLLLRREGEAWVKVETGTQAGLRAIWGVGPTEVWVGGEEGTLLRFDGNAWMRVAAPTSATIQALWSTPGAGLWLSASDGWLWRLWPTGWEPMQKAWSTALGGTGSDNVWVSNPSMEVALVHWDGGSWSSPPSPPIYMSVRAIASSGTDVLLGAWAMSGAENFVRWNGTNWSVESVGDTYPHGLCASPGGELWMVGGMLAPNEQAALFEKMLLKPAAILHKPAPK